MQLGICWVKFEGPPLGRPGSAHDVASTAVKVCDGKKISVGDERIRVVLDGRGKRAEQAVKEEMERRYPPKKPYASPSGMNVTPLSRTAMATTSRPPNASNASTPLIDKQTLDTYVKPPIIGPGVPKPLGQKMYHRPSAPPIVFNNIRFRDESFLRRPFNAGLGSILQQQMVPGRPVQQLASSFTSAPFVKHHRERREDSWTNERGRRLKDDSSTRHGRARTLSRSSFSSFSSSSSYSEDSEEERPRRPTKLPYPQRKRLATGPSKEDEYKMENVRETIRKNGHPCVFIDAKSLPAVREYESYLRDHFKVFKPAEVSLVLNAMS